MSGIDTARINRRGLFRFALAVTAAALVARPDDATARPKWGNPPGWSRGRKRGWGKKGGPKRR